MNAKAVELGLTNSHFVNSTGLDDPGHLMSVRDLATLARRIIQEFPEYYSIYSEREFTYADIRQPNRNPLLQSGVPGVDGMKTGYTDDAGYGLVTSAKRDDRRLILVVAGLDFAQGSAVPRRSGCWSMAFASSRSTRSTMPARPSATVDVWLGAAADRAAGGADATVAVTLPREARNGLVAKLFYDNPVAGTDRAGPDARPRRDHRTRHRSVDRAAGRWRRRARGRDARPLHRCRRAI